MRDAIKNFNRQFEFQPEIQNSSRLKNFDTFIVAGMGGSHLGADLVKTWNPGAKLTIHTDYWPLAEDEVALKRTLLIASSYSGNTEETLDVFQNAVEKNIPLAAIATGGKLLELAKRANTPFIQLPATGIQPRMATGFSFVALLKLMGEDEALQEVRGLAQRLRPENFEASGKALAQKLNGFVPVIYASSRNRALAYNWKIKFNETGKIPAFYNVFPELNHNEMTGFDVADSTRELAKNFYFVILKDPDDEPRILKRMNVLARLFQEKGLPLEMIEVNGQDIFEKIFSNLVLADWAAFYTAESYGLEAEAVPMVEEFKKLL